MIEIGNEYKEKVIESLIERFNSKKEFGLTTKQFVKIYGVDDSIISRLKKGERGSLISDAKILNAGSVLKITLNNRKWNTVNTDVFEAVSKDIMVCKNGGKFMMLCDDCGIGKSYTAKYICNTTPNSFFLSCKRARTKNKFVRELANAIGLEHARTIDGTLDKVIAVLKSIPQPLVILDDLGYVNDETVIQVLDLLDATEDVCGWYAIGDDSLEERMDRSIRVKKIGFRALFSRAGKKYVTVTPQNSAKRVKFYRKLITDVVTANVPEGTVIPKELITQCLHSDSGELIGDLRRASTKIMLEYPN